MQSQSSKQLHRGLRGRLTPLLSSRAGDQRCREPVDQASRFAATWTVFSSESALMRPSDTSPTIATRCDSFRRTLLKKARSCALHPAVDLEPRGSPGDFGRMTSGAYICGPRSAYADAVRTAHIQESVISYRTLVRAYSSSEP